MSTLTQEERCRRVKAALAEAGYPDASVKIARNGGVEVRPLGLPWGVIWRAGALTDPSSMPCWPCYERAGSSDGIARLTCTHDPLTSPWPEAA